MHTAMFVSWIMQDISADRIMDGWIGLTKKQWASSNSLTVVSKFSPHLPAKRSNDTHRKCPVEWKYNFQNKPTN